mgnify:FL=1
MDDNKKAKRLFVSLVISVALWCFVNRFVIPLDFITYIILEFLFVITKLFSNFMKRSLALFTDTNTTENDINND